MEDAQAAERLRTAERLAAAASSGKTVSLAIDLGDGVPRLYDDVAWHEAMTVEDLLAAVSRMPGGPRFARQGSGASALLAEIDGTANEGSEGRNWVYFVNDRRGDRSFAVYRLEPGDRVLWKFAVQE